MVLADNHRIDKLEKKGPAPRRVERAVAGAALSLSPQIRGRGLAVLRVKRCNATSAHIASTTPNGQAPETNP